MDETAFRQKLSEMIERPCTFEKAILAGCVECSRAERIQIAERESVACQNQACLSRCTSLLDHLRHSFAFVLKNVREDAALSHAQEMRVQCGGLLGLQNVLNSGTEVDNVDALLDSVLLRWGELSAILYSEVVHAAALCYKGRHG
jgi:hypothetical protein